MKKARIVKSKTKIEQNTVQEEYSIKKLLIIILAIILVFTIFYFITSLVVKPSEKTSTIIPNKTHDDSEILLNHLLDRSEEKYFVLATKASLYENYSSQTNYIEIYKKYITDYRNKENSLNVYFVDLDDSINKAYMSDESNITSDLSKLKLNDETLFEIKNGKIEKYYEGSKKIIEALSSLN